jgi:hypothetical protein
MTDVFLAIIMSLGAWKFYKINTEFENLWQALSQLEAQKLDKEP